MLRSRGDGLIEFRALEASLGASAPRRLAPARREALRLRIMAALGEQERRRSPLPAIPARWVAIPAGAGIAATIIAAGGPLFEALYGEGGAPASRPVVLGPAGVLPLAPGERVEAAGPVTLVSPLPGVRADLEPGAVARLPTDGEAFHLALDGGRATVAAAGRPVQVEGPGWTMRLESGVAIVAVAAQGVSITAVEGTVSVVTTDGACSASAGDRIEVAGGRCRVLPAAAPRVPAEREHAAPGSVDGTTAAGSGAAGGERAIPEPAPQGPATPGNTHPPAPPGPPEQPGNGNPPAPPGPPVTPPGHGGTPPGAGGNAGGKKAK
jgi:hypothetical protein